ncbi:MAG: hypothetical protein QM723_14440 [Myxococcaceae bacterium]
MATDSVSAAAAAEARQRAIEEARARAEAEARKRAAEEAARQKAAEAAARAHQQQAQAQKAKQPTKTFKTDDLSTGKGGALRRAAANKLSAQGLDPAQPANTTGQTLKAKDLLAGKKVDVSDPTKDAASLAKISDPGQRADAFEKLVAKNKDNASYQQQLMTQSKASLEDIARKAVDKDSGASQASRQQAIDSLAKATEEMKPTEQKQLADTFAGTMKNQNVGDDSNEFGTLMKNSVKDGSGASFGVRVASSLQSSNKTTAANDLSKFVGQGINDLKSDFEDAQKKVDDLHTRLAQELPTWKLEGKDQTTALKQFNEDNHLDDATKDLEAKGALLASTLDGAHIASTDPALTKGAAEKQAIFGGRAGSYSAPKYSNESDLVGAANGALGDVGKLADTKAGAEKITDAVEKSGEGEETFLDGLAEKTEKGEDGVKVLNKLRSAVVQSLGSKLLGSAADGSFDAEKSKLLSGLNANRALFGASEEQMKGFTDSLNEFKPGMTAEELDAATKNTASKISELGEGGGAVAQSLKGLGVVFGAIGAVKDWSNFSQQDVQEKLATISSTLTVGNEGANLITSTFSRFAANSAEGEAGAQAAETVGLTAGKLLGAGIGALGTVVSGWQAFDAFKDGKITEGVGDTMTAVGGAVATAGLFLDGTIAGAPAGVVLNVVGGVLAAGGAIVSLFGSKDNPFEGQEDDLDHVFKALGVKDSVAEQLKDFNSDGQNFGTWTSTVAKQMGMSTGDFVRSMNNWSDQQVTDFLDAARLQHDTDSNNGNRLDNASAVLGETNAKGLEDPTPIYYGGRGAVYNPNAARAQQAQKDSQAALRETVDEKTGEITYKQSLVDATVQWLRAGRPEK